VSPRVLVRHAGQLAAAKFGVPYFVPSLVQNTQQLVAATLGRATACTRFTGRQLDLAHSTHSAKQLKSVDERMVLSEQCVYTDYADPRRAEWITKIQPSLKNLN